MKMKLNVILIKKKKKKPYNTISNHFDRKSTYLELTPKN